MNSARSVATPFRPWSRAGARAASLALGLALLAGCGQKGPLYVPAPAAPAAVPSVPVPAPVGPASSPAR